MLHHRGRVSLESLIAAEAASDLPLGQVEQLMEAGRDAANAANALAAAYESLVAAGGCRCRSDKTWLYRWPDEHQSATCDCLCDRCSGAAEWAASLAELPPGPPAVIDEWYYKQLGQVGRLPWVSRARSEDGGEYDHELSRARRVLGRIRAERTELTDEEIELAVRIEQERLRQEREQLEDEQAAAAHRAWLATPEGIIQTAREEAEREDERREQARKRQERLQREDDWARANHDRLLNGPDDGLIRATGDPLADIRALVAAASASDYYREAADPVTGETRDWGDRAPGDVAKIGHLGLLFVKRDANGGSFLVELRAEACREHQAAVLREREADPDIPDWYFCNSDCAVRIREVRISTWRQLKAYFSRGDWHLCTWDDRRLFVADGFRWAGSSWKDEEISDESWRLAMEDNYWPGCWPLVQVAAQPMARSDGSMASGYDRASGFWMVPALAPGQQALPPSLTEIIAGIADRVGPAGIVMYMSDLAGLIHWAGSPRALSAAVRKTEAALDAIDVEIEHLGKGGLRRLPQLRIAKRSAGSATSAWPAIMPGQRTSDVRDVPPG
jgi:hypothetical protein